jgi:hypothetical protein
MDPTPIEAQASRSEGRGSSDPRGLDTHSGPRAGLLMTSDVACARPLSPGSGEGQRHLRTRGVSGRERASRQTRALPDLWLLISRSWRSAAHACGAISASSVTWLELAVWLARSLPATPRGTFPAKTPSLATACKRPPACGPGAAGGGSDRVRPHGRRVDVRLRQQPAAQETHNLE